MLSSSGTWVVVGRVSGVYGVQGWVKIASYTVPQEQILTYSPWYIAKGTQWSPLAVVAKQSRGGDIVVQFESCQDRNQALAFSGMEISVPREQLPSLEPEEYYWTDLEGLEVFHKTGDSLGRVAYLFETGANDVVVVHGSREHLIPFIRNQFVLSVDLEKKQLIVDWDPDF